jgi:superfamily II DNA helicase RecQ
LRVLPPRVTAATLSGSQSTAKLAAIVDDILKGHIKVLFVSPERLTSPSFRRLFRPKWIESEKVKRREFPPVSLMCVDEAHCISQWGHNFRPSYLRLAAMVDMVEPKSVLAITATAGPRVVADISQTLGIVHTPEADMTESDSGVMFLGCNRGNIAVRCFVLNTQEERLKKVRLLCIPCGCNSSSRSFQLSNAHTSMLS